MDNNKETDGLLAGFRSTGTPQSKEYHPGAMQAYVGITGKGLTSLNFA